MKKIQMICLIVITGTVVLAFGNTARDNLIRAGKQRHFITVSAEENRATCERLYGGPYGELGHYNSCIARGAHQIEVQ
jgi:hypothetical protein